ncbi:hypothetical protein ACVWV0_004334 [Ewingella americana]
MTPDLLSLESQRVRMVNSSHPGSVNLAKDLLGLCS